MGERLAAGNTAIALLANSLATGAALIAIILSLGPVSGAHINPAVTLAAALRGELPWRETPVYLIAQLIGGIAGVTIAHLMFGLPLFSLSLHARSGTAQIFSEFIATFGLFLVIRGSLSRPAVLPFAVGAYITAAYWFTASTSFANPAVTIGRTLTPTYAGIAPSSAPAFIIAQVIGAALGTLLALTIHPAPSTTPAGAETPAPLTG